MIISASRRTDIPSFYGRWFMNRVREGWCQVPNPLNTNQVAYVSLRPIDVDAIVFWSKDPSPMFEHFDELDGRGFRYYFQFTLNDYPEDLEPRLPSLPRRLDTFRRLSNRLGAVRVVWRYDPVIVSNVTPIEFHKQHFGELARSLKGFTRRVAVSVLDDYRHVRAKLGALESKGFDVEWRNGRDNDIRVLMQELASLAKENDMTIYSCAEETDFSEQGVPPGRCIDDELLRALWPSSLFAKKDPNQRRACLCVASKDVGVNDTCLHACAYCYATRSVRAAEHRYREHDPDSPVLWGKSRGLSEGELAHQRSERLI